MTSQAPPPAAGQSGAVLIEVIISAVVLVTALLGLFKVLDVQTSASANGRAASLAANLAEEDQERLRSFRTADLAGRDETRTRTVDGRDYTVKSTGAFVRDNPTGTQSCTAAGAQDDYLRITSEVTAPQSGDPKTAPVRVSSIVALPVSRFAPGQGRLSVAVTGGAGQVIKGVTVSIAGPVNQSAQTNTLGCAVFDSVPEGDYTYTVSASGFVDPKGNAEASDKVTVSEGKIAQAAAAYDRAGTVNVSFDTKQFRSSPQPDSSRRLSAANSEIPGAGVMVTPDPTANPSASFRSTITADNLYPFTSPYTFYGGSCPSANPATYDSGYFGSNPGSVVVGPGSSISMTVRVPALRVYVTTQAANTRVRIRARSTDPLCTEVFDWTVTTNSYSTPFAYPAQPGVPFGTYNVCAYSLESDGGRATTKTNVDVTDPNGSNIFGLQIENGNGSGCP